MYDHLLDRFAGDMLRLDLHHDRVLRPLRSELQDQVGQGRAEEQGLAFALRRRGVHDAAHVRDEAHVQHAVGLVDDEHLHAVQVQDVPLVEIQQAAGRRDHHVDRFVDQLLLLLVEIHAAEDGHRVERAVATDGVRLLLDLHDQLARRREDQDAGTADPAARRRRMAQQAREQADQERGGLARAGLRAPGRVDPLKRLRENGRLDRRAVLKAEVGDRVQDLRGQVEILETRGPFARRHLEKRGIPWFRRGRWFRRGGDGGGRRGASAVWGDPAGNHPAGEIQAFQGRGFFEAVADFLYNAS